MAWLEPLTRDMVHQALMGARSVNAAASALGVSHNHLTRGARRDPSLREALEACRARGLTNIGRVAGQPRQSRRPGSPPDCSIVPISLATKDLEIIDRLVSRMKARGLQWANRSALIRHALAVADTRLTLESLLDGTPVSAHEIAPRAKRAIISKASGRSFRNQ